MVHEALDITIIAIPRRSRQGRGFLKLLTLERAGRRMTRAIQGTRGETFRKQELTRIWKFGSWGISSECCILSNLLFSCYRASFAFVYVNKRSKEDDCHAADRIWLLSVCEGRSWYNNFRMRGMGSNFTLPMVRSVRKVWTGLFSKDIHHVISRQTHP